MKAVTYIATNIDDKLLPFHCYHIVVHLVCQLLEKDKFFRILINALDDWPFEENRFRQPTCSDYALDDCGR